MFCFYQPTSTSTPLNGKGHRGPWDSTWRHPKKVTVSMELAFLKPKNVFRVHVKFLVCILCMSFKFHRRWLNHKKWHKKNTLLLFPTQKTASLEGMADWFQPSLLYLRLDGRFVRGWHDTKPASVICRVIQKNPHSWLFISTKHNGAWF